YGTWRSGLVLCRCWSPDRPPRQAGHTSTFPCELHTTSWHQLRVEQPTVTCADSVGRPARFSRYLWAEAITIRCVYLRPSSPSCSIQLARTSFSMAARDCSLASATAPANGVLRIYCHRKLCALGSNS